VLNGGSLVPLRLVIGVDSASNGGERIWDLNLFGESHADTKDK
jgi:hypothetical protein